MQRGKLLLPRRTNQMHRARNFGRTGLRPLLGRNGLLHLQAEGRRAGLIHSKKRRFAFVCIKKRAEGETPFLFAFCGIFIIYMLKCKSYLFSGEVCFGSFPSGVGKFQWKRMAKMRITRMIETEIKMAARRGRCDKSKT